MLSPCEHRLLHFEVAEVLSPINNERIAQLLVPLNDLLSDSFLMATALLRLVVCMAHLALEVRHITLIEIIICFKLCLTLNNLLFLLGDIGRCDVLKR